MTYYVQKALPLGPIRFGVSVRRPLDAVDDDPALSTGPKGEFVRRRDEGFFFGDTARVAEPMLPPAPSISQTPFLSSLTSDGTLRGYGFLAMMIAGLLLLLLGFAVVTRKGPQGWVEVILGIVLIAVPIATTARRRGQIREQEERERAEREQIEERSREHLTWYVKAVHHLVETERTDAAIDALRGERATLTLPYELWAPLARGMILQIGFDELARRGVTGSNAIADLLHRAGIAAGLIPEDIKGVTHDLYTTVFWHLLADDRVGDLQQKQLDALRDGLGISDSDTLEVLSAAQFRDLRGITTANLPRAHYSIELGFQEYCIHQAPLDDGAIVITNRRLIVDEKKRAEVALPKVFDVVVDVDSSIVTVKTDEKTPLQLRLGYPIFTAAMIDLAASLDERPRGFA
jgi:hypothetical protein